MQTEQKVRSGAIDVVRVVGIVAVVAGHISTEGAIRPLLYTWHVPLFFVLVGYFWSSRRTVREEAVSRFRSLVIPTLVWGTAIYLVYSAVALSLGEFSGLVPASAYMAYWFTPALFFSALLCRSLSSFPSWVSWGIATVGVAAAYVAEDAVAAAPLYLGTVLPGLFFVMAGRAARQYRPHLRLRFVLPAFVTVAVLIALGISAPIDMKAGELGTPILSVLGAVVIAVTLIVLAESIVPHLPGFVSTVSTRLALAGWAVVLGHAAFILMLRDFGAHPVVVFAGALVLPWVIGLLALSSPVSLAITGSPQRGVKGTPSNRSRARASGSAPVE